MSFCKTKILGGLLLKYLFWGDEWTTDLIRNTQIVKSERIFNLCIKGKKDQMRKNAEFYFLHDLSWSEVQYISNSKQNKQDNFVMEGF